MKSKIQNSRCKDPRNQEWRAIQSNDDNDDRKIKDNCSDEKATEAKEEEVNIEIAETWYTEGSE